MRRRMTCDGTRTTTALTCTLKFNKETNASGAKGRRAPDHFSKQAPATSLKNLPVNEKAKNSRGGWEEKKPRLSHSQPVSHLNLCLLLNLFSNASDALRAALADGRHYVPLSLNLNLNT